MLNALIDRVLQLVKLRTERRRRFFKDSIEPLQKSMVQINDDYVDSFMQIRTRLPKSSASKDQPEHNLLQTERVVSLKDIRPLLEELNKLSMRCDAMRNAVRTDARVLPSYTRKEEEIIYFAAVLEYFQPANYSEFDSTGNTPLSELTCDQQSTVQTDFRATYKYIDHLDSQQLRTLLLLGEPVDPTHSISTAIDRILELKRKRWRVVSKAYSRLRARISQLE